jgi:hypothetical protein
VGPRPCIPYEYERYSAWQRNRLKGVPGLTGLWQVSGKNRTTFDEMVRLDIAYVESLSFLEDIRIMLCTLPALWTQISDTRKARAASIPSAAAAASAGPEITAPPNSATFVARSQNVIAGTGVAEHQNVTQQSTQVCVSYRTRSEAGELQARSDGNPRALSGGG